MENIPFFHKGFIDIRWWRISSINTNSRKWRFRLGSPLLEMEYTPEILTVRPLKIGGNPKRKGESLPKHHGFQGLLLLSFRVTIASWKGPDTPKRYPKRTLLYPQVKQKKMDQTGWKFVSFNIQPWKKSPFVAKLDNELWVSFCCLFLKIDPKLVGNLVCGFNPSEKY